MRHYYNFGNYNYSIFDLGASYKRFLSELLDDQDMAQLFGDPPKKFLIVSFPAIEKDNLLLHSVFAHEVGHQMADKYLSGEDTTNLTTRIMEIIEGEKKNFPDLDKIFGEKEDPLFKTQYRQQILKIIYDLRNGFLHELLSDIAAVHLLGPAGLISMAQFASVENIDRIPPPWDFHPPWRYRFREAYKEIVELKFGESIENIAGKATVIAAKDAALRFLQQLKKSVDTYEDRANIDRSYNVKIAINLVEEVLQPARDFVRRGLAEIRYTKDLVEKQCPDLITRLSLGVPPNELIKEGKSFPVDFRSAINAGWFYRLSRIALPSETGEQGGLDDLDRLNRLVQKGIELAILHAEFNSTGGIEK